MSLHLSLALIDEKNNIMICVRFLTFDITLHSKFFALLTVLFILNIIL